ncbi:unnamed protein product [Phytophthora lilii]|uniref:Unnamed protein product n=1 Tax=Phytophthora lilii TaxID=2077276 RepID=A0A9W7CQD3_9STRA|nr:unnamed protein product [Phytophthora lilii]
MTTYLLALAAVVTVLFAFLTQATEPTRPNAQTHMTTDWPSLRFNFTVKRSSMQVHRQSDFTILARPVVSTDATSVLYDAFATFTEDATTYNYSLVGGISYVSFTSPDNMSSLAQCTDSEILPSISFIVSALNNATPISSISTSSGRTIECYGGKLLKAEVNGIAFGLCFSGSSGLQMYGNDMDIFVEYEKEQVEIKMPIAEDKCNAVALSSLVTSIGKSLLTGSAISSSPRHLEADFGLGFLLHDDHSCSCKSTPRPCVFVEGLGALTEKEENVAEDPYWGNLTKHAPCCSSMEYVILNTVNNSWANASQQQKVCDHLLAVNEANQKSIISDTIIVTHSMGSLLLAGAIANGECSLAKSTSWVATAAPMRGSMASDYFQNSCKDDTNFIMEKLIERTGYCPADDGIKSLAYENESYSTPELNAAYAAAQVAYRKNIYASLCSNGYSGLPSNRQVAYWVLGTVVNHKSFKNDGMVEFYSCAGGFPESKFGNRYHDRFYVTELNHADTAFRHGDALFNKAKMPVKWFECVL